MIFIITVDGYGTEQMATILFKEKVLTPMDFLEQMVLGEIQRLTKFVNQFENELVKAVIGHFQHAEALTVS